MSVNVLTSRLPWQDRWTQPTLAQLLEPLKIQHRRLFEQLMEELQSFEHVDQVIHWYGSAWNWTIQYRLHDAKASEPHTLLYLVPRVETPIICIPLSDGMIEQLPMKRLNRFIRDGIKNAKCAVAIHWATWTPNSKAEVTFLADLLKRKCKLILGVATKGAANKDADLDGDDQEDGPSTPVRKGQASAKAGKVTGKSAGQASNQASVKTPGKSPGKSAGKSDNAGEKQAKGQTAAGKAPAGKPPAGKSPAKAETSKPVAKPAQAQKTSKSAKGVAVVGTAGKKAAASKTANRPKPTNAKPANAKPASKTAPKPAAVNSAAAGKVKKSTKTPAGKPTAKPVPGRSAASGSKAGSKPAAKSAGKPASKAGGKAAPAAVNGKAQSSSRPSKPVAQVKAGKSRPAKRSGKAMAAAGSRKK